MLVDTSSIYEHFCDYTEFSTDLGAKAFAGVVDVNISINTEMEEFNDAVEAFWTALCNDNEDIETASEEFIDLYNDIDEENQLELGDTWDIYGSYSSTLP